jgi:hypothetical protein
LRNAKKNVREQIKDCTNNKGSSGGVVRTADTEAQHTVSERRFEEQEELYPTKDEGLKVSDYMKECIKYHQNVLE